MCREILALPFALYEFYVLGVLGDVREKKRRRVRNWTCPQCGRRFTKMEYAGDLIVFYHGNCFCTRPR